jgi:CheY-like chemotaxis protein
MLVSPRSSALIVVEDDPGLRELVSRVLGYAAPGYLIITVSNGADALDALAQYTVPLLITDYHMVGMDGIELTAAIKAIAPATYVVLLTAYASRQLEQAAYTAGADMFLEKPFTIDRLMALVQAALANDDDAPSAP